MPFSVGILHQRKHVIQIYHVSAAKYDNCIFSQQSLWNSCPLTGSNLIGWQWTWVTLLKYFNEEFDKRSDIDDVVTTFLVMAHTIKWLYSTHPEMKWRCPTYNLLLHGCQDMLCIYSKNGIQKHKGPFSFHRLLTQFCFNTIYWALSFRPPKPVGWVCLLLFWN